MSVWVTAFPLPASEAIQELRAAWAGVDDASQAGALRIIDFDQWYGTAGKLKGQDVIEFWLAEEERALAEGYTGLRITGNTSFLTPDDWPTFMEYEQALSAHFNGRRIITLCSYALMQCNDQQKSQVMHAHHCALEQEDGIWQVLPGTDSLLKSRHGYNGDVRGAPATLQSGSPSAANDGKTTPASKSYRCYFTDGNDRIQTYEQIECEDDAKAALKAQGLLAGSRFTSAEVWLGSRLVGKWSNTCTVS
jgi:hypothetical protein